MGYCLHLDGLLDRVIEARDLHLVKDGLIFPNILNFKCALIHDAHFCDHRVEYWDEVYGVSMKSMKKWISHEPCIRVVDPSMLVSSIAKIINFNLQTATYQEVTEVTKSVELVMLGEGHSNGVAFWFETDFTQGL